MYDVGDAVEVLEGAEELTRHWHRLGLAHCTARVQKMAQRVAGQQLHHDMEHGWH